MQFTLPQQHRASVALCRSRSIRQGHPRHAQETSQACLPRQLAEQATSAVGSAVLSAAILLSAAGPAAASEIKLDANPVFDGANVLKADARDALSRKLSELDSATGFHVRLFTQYQVDASAAGPKPRQLWGSLDKQTVVVAVDPSSPNILSVPFVGDDVLAKLRRPFWTELESRFGNMFYVREEGEAVAVLGAMSALVDCLGRPDGCRVVPGLPPEQYFFTLWCAIAGGVVAGLVAQIKPQGIVQRRWVWLLLFSPLWGSLFINFGLGPVVSRTADLAPIAGNVLGFAVAAAAPSLLRKAWGGSGDDNGQQQLGDGQ